jgi:hypothetical protein
MAPRCQRGPACWKFGHSTERWKYWVTGVLVALAFGFAYFFTSRSVVAISSAAETIRGDIASVTEATVHDLINKIEEAKDIRYRLRTSL